MGKLLSAAKLAENLGITPESVYRLAKLGIIPFYKVGPRLGGRRFDVDEVRETLRHSPAEMMRSE